MKNYRITVGGQTFEVEVLSDPRLEKVQVRVDGETLAVRVGSTERPRPVTTAAQPAEPQADEVPSSSPATHPSGGKHLTSPLPGTIVQVHVRPGQAVSKGDQLLVIEAMKMNNQIRAPRNGSVGEVLAQVGQQVGHGDPLLTWAD